MIWGLILQGLVIVQAVMGKLVTVTYHFNHATDGQWAGGIQAATVTAKGSSVIGDLATIIHYGMDFVAQFIVLLPAASSTTYIFNGTNVAGIAIPAPLP